MDLKAVHFENLLNNYFMVDIMDDCEPNEGGFYCRIYDRKRLEGDDGHLMPIDFGDYLDDFCIHIGDCSFKVANIVDFIYSYIKNNFKEEDLA